MRRKEKPQTLNIRIKQSQKPVSQEEAKRRLVELFSVLWEIRQANNVTKE